MRRLFLILMMPAAACVNAPPNDSAICQATRQARADHAAAIAKGEEAETAVTGANLITLIDEGCRA